MHKIATKSPESQYWRSVIFDYAQRYGADPELMVRIARCESGFNPAAQNKTSSASGIYQYINSTWQSQSLKYGITTQKNDPYGQIELTARILADGGIHHWDASANCHSIFPK